MTLSKTVALQTYRLISVAKLFMWLVAMVRCFGSCPMLSWDGGGRVRGFFPKKQFGVTVDAGTSR